MTDELKQTTPQVWIARDANGRLYVSNDKPTLYQKDYFISVDMFEIDSRWFPEVTYENSPRKVELKLIQQ